MGSRSRAEVWRSGSARRWPTRSRGASVPPRASGTPSELDFWTGALQAALFGFRDFESLPLDDVPKLRHVTVIDAVFGPVTFVGVLLPDWVEIAAFALDPDYWNLIDDDPDD